MTSAQYTAIQHGQVSPIFPSRILYFRILGYILLEGGFFFLAGLALNHPLIISTPLSTTNGKAAFTVTFILWQFLATECLQAIIQHVFASEWQRIASESNAHAFAFTDSSDPSVQALYRAVSQAFPSQSSGNLLAFLFFGSNETYQGPREAFYSWSTILNLDGIPSTYNATGLSLQSIVGDSFNTSAPLAALLVCDPQLQITSGQATIWPNGTLNVINSSLGSSDRLGNFPDDHFETWLTVGSRNVFQSALSQESWMRGGDESMFDFNCAWTFLNDSSLSTNTYVYGRGIIPLPINKIQDNLNTMFRSILKTYSDGVRRDFNAPGIFAHETTLVQAETRNPAMALVTNEHLFYIGIVLSIAELLLMGALCITRDWQDRKPLSLGSIFATTGKGAESQKGYLVEDHPR